MTWTGDYDHPNGDDTVYAKPKPHSADPSWGADVVAAVDNSDDTRQKSFPGLADGVKYSVFKQAGGSPASTDTVFMVMQADVVSAINADATQATARSNAATAATEATAAAASAATAATEATAARKLGEADDILVLSGGVYKLEKRERGTEVLLAPAKTAKQPSGADLTDPTTERLAGYTEE